MRRRTKKPLGSYALGSDRTLPLFSRENDFDWNVWIVTWRWPWGDVTQRFKLTGLTRQQIQKKIKDAPTLWDVVKFLTNSEWSQQTRENFESGFRVFVEGVGASVRKLIQMHFSIQNLADKIDTSKLSSFLALPSLRDVAPPDRIESLNTTLDSLSSTKKKDLTYNWLAGSLENQSS